MLIGRWVAPAGVFIVVACSPPSEFVCTSDAACDVDGSKGVCQPTGYCSLPDTDCVSGQRYVEHAPAQLRGACVESPWGIAATAINHHRIDVTWQAQGETDAYDIEQNGVVIRTGISGTSFRSMGLTPSTEYVFRVRKSAEPDDWSPPASATTGPEPEPTNSYPEHVLADEPRAFWRMEETSGTVVSDSTGNIAAGLLEGTGDPNVPGRLGSGTFFDGDTGHASLGTVHTAESEWGWSWELWVDFVALHEIEGGLLSCDNSPRWTLNQRLGTITVGMSHRMDTLQFIGVDTGVSLPLGWHHLVLTVQGAITEDPVMTMYLDGDLVYRHDTFDVSIHSPWSRGEGGQIGAGDLVLDRVDSYTSIEGSYDEGAAYDYVLNGGQVKRHYQAAADGR